MYRRKKLMTLYKCMCIFYRSEKRKWTTSKLVHVNARSDDNNNNNNDDNDNDNNSKKKNNNGKVSPWLSINYCNDNADDDANHDENTNKQLLPPSPLPPSSCVSPTPLPPSSHRRGFSLPLGSRFLFNWILCIWPATLDPSSSSRDSCCKEEVN